VEAKTPAAPDAAAQPAQGITRIDLQRDDLSVPGREMIQNRRFIVEKGSR
jgi:hypothetical protein